MKILQVAFLLLFSDVHSDKQASLYNMLTFKQKKRGENSKT